MKALFSFLLIALCVTAYTPYAVRAQEVATVVTDEDTAARDPEEQKAYDAFMAGTKEFTDKPFDNPALEFTIRLPKDWTRHQILNQGDTNTTHTLLGKVSHFTGPAIGDIRPVLIVETIQLEHEITADHWIKNFALTNGFTMRESKAVSEHRSDGAYSTIENGIPLYIRFTAQIYGNIMILTRYSVPEFAGEVHDIYMRFALESLQMKNPTKGNIEHFKPFVMREIISFKYPLTWDLRYPRFLEGERIKIELHNKTKNTNKLNGLITIIATKKEDGTSLEAESKRIFDEVTKDNQVNMGELMFSRIPPSYLRFTYALQEAYGVAATKKHIAQEVWFTVFEDDEWYFFIHLLSPHKDEIFYDWARNTRALELLLRSIE